MNVNAAMRELPDVFRAVAAQRTEYGKIIRESRWAEGLVTIITGHDSISAALAGAQAVEFLLGWPAATREADHFLNYSISALRPRAIVVAISGDGENEEVVSAASDAARRGAAVLAVTWNRESALAQCSRAVLPLPPPAGEFPQFAAHLILHAALLEIALAAAKVFNPRNPKLEGIEFDALPELAASINLHLADPLRALALQINDCRRLLLVGDGFYYPSALQTATAARQAAQKIVEPIHAGDAMGLSARAVTSQDAFLFLSGSHDGMKKRIHAAAARLSASGARVFAATDGNDRALIDSSDFSLLMPETSELAGSLLSLLLLQRLILELAKIT